MYKLISSKRKKKADYKKREDSITDGILCFTIILPIREPPHLNRVSDPPSYTNKNYSKLRKLLGNKSKKLECFFMGYISIDLNT